VHLATRNWLRKEELLAQWSEKAIIRLEEVFPGDNHKNTSIWRTYLPHVRYVLKSDLVNKYEEIRIDLAWRYGICLYGDGRWNEAEVPFLQVMGTRTRVLGEEHPATLTSMASLASTYSRARAVEGGRRARKPSSRESQGANDQLTPPQYSAISLPH
jgi:hypothetical protein